MDDQLRRPLKISANSSSTLLYPVRVSIRSGLSTAIC